MVVLPVPGPPVMTRTFEERASSTAWLWLSASTNSDLAASQSHGLAGIDPGHGSFPVCQTRNDRPAIAFSA